MLLYIILMAPVFLLAMAAQWMVRSAFQQMSQVQASMTGAQAARQILDHHGLYNVQIEQVPGELSDHYDPSSKVVRLSQHVYGAPSMAAVGIAAHEVGHALQDAKQYAPLVVRNLAVPLANFGGNFGSFLAMIGMGMLFTSLAGIGKFVLLFGIASFAMVVFFQLVNLPVEFNASSRAKTELISLGIVNGHEISNVSKVLNAAALTYVAAAMQSVVTLLYFVIRYLEASRR